MLGLGSNRGRGWRGRECHRIFEDMETPVTETAIPVLWVAFVTSPNKFYPFLLPLTPKRLWLQKISWQHISVWKKKTMEKVFKHPKRYGFLPFTLILGHFSNTTLSLQPYHFNCAQRHCRFLLNKIATSTCTPTHGLETLPLFRFLWVWCLETQHLVQWIPIQFTYLSFLFLYFSTG